MGDRKKNTTFLFGFQTLVLVTDLL